MKTIAKISFGLAVLLGALGFVVAGSSAQIGFFASGGVCVVLALQFTFLMLGSEKQEREMAGARANGHDATVSVVEVRETNHRINGNPKLCITVNVSVEGRDTYQATSTRVFPASAARSLDVGRSYPAKVDAADPSIFFVPAWTDTLEEKEQLTGDEAPVLLSEGRRGRATILNVFEPVLMAPNPELVGLALEVRVDDGRPAFEVRIAHPAPAGRQRECLIKREVDVAVDRWVPQRVAVDWSSL